jgi:hypothetical protein
MLIVQFVLNGGKMNRTNLKLTVVALAIASLFGYADSGNAAGLKRSDSLIVKTDLATISGAVEDSKFAPAPHEWPNKIKPPVGPYTPMVPSSDPKKPPTIPLTNPVPGQVYPIRWINPRDPNDIQYHPYKWVAKPAPGHWERVDPPAQS